MTISDENSLVQNKTGVVAITYRGPNETYNYVLLLKHAAHIIDCAVC